MAIHLVQYAPEIPYNTINMMRICMGTRIKLHLIKPLGFLMDRKRIERVGFDFFDEVDYVIYENWQTFSETNNNGNFYFLTQNGTKAYYQIDFSDVLREHFIILGAESCGFPKELLSTYMDHCFRVPMKSDVESLNVSSVGAIVVYEALRQQNFLNL